MGKQKTYKSRFTTALKVEILHDTPKGRNVKLLQDLVYWDSENVKWVAPKGSIVNGASIPKLFWRATGSPYVGLYRRASVIHDVYCEFEGYNCEQKKKFDSVDEMKEKIFGSKTSEQVHAVFKEMMLTDGVKRYKANYMHWAVKTFGPRW